MNKALFPLVAALMILIPSVGISQQQNQPALTDSGTLTVQILTSPNQFLPGGFEVFALQQLGDSVRLTSAVSDFFQQGQQLSSFQYLELDAQFHPTSYTLYKRQSDGTESVVRAQFNGAQVDVSVQAFDGSGKKEQTLTSTTPQGFVIVDTNMLSDFLILFKRVIREPTGNLTFDLLIPQKFLAAPVTISRVSPATLRSGGNSFQADEYDLNLGQMFRIFGISGRFIGFLQEAQGTSPELLIFRSDLFPQGFEVVKAP